MAANRAAPISPPFSGRFEACSEAGFHRSRQPAAVGVDDAHGETAREARHQRAHLAEPDDAERPAVEPAEALKAGPIVGDPVARADARAVPAVRPHRGLGSAQPLGQRQHQQHRVLRRVMEGGPGQARHDDPSRRRRMEIDAVAAGADALHQAQLRTGIEQRAIDGAAAEDQDRRVAAPAQSGRLGEWDHRHPVGRMQPAPGRKDVGGIDRFGRKELVHIGVGDLARPRQRIAGQAHDMVVVEDCDPDRLHGGRGLDSQVAGGAG
jgi:hypothetical protein